jgi:hypothetical protein
MVSTLFKNLTSHQITKLDFSENSLDFQDTLDSLLILDFQDTGIMVKSLIETAYTSGITGLEDVDEKNGTITGIFLDKVSPTQTRRFNFKITAKGITYKEILDPPEYSEDDRDYLNFEAQILDFKLVTPKTGDRTRADRLGRIKTCNPAKSFVCGATCKSNGFSCTTKYSPAQQQQYNQIVQRSQAMKSEDLNQYLTNTTKSTQVTATPQKSTPLSAKPTGGSTVKQGLQQIGEGVKTTGKGLKEVMTGVFNRAKAKFGDAVQGVKSRVQAGRQALNDSVVKGADRAANAVKRAATEDITAGVKTKAGEVKRSLATGVASAADSAAEKFKSGVDSTAGKLKGGADKAASRVKKSVGASLSSSPQSPAVDPPENKPERKKKKVTPTARRKRSSV